MSTKPEQERGTVEAPVGPEWACIGHDPRTRWGLGIVVDGKMEPIATVERNDNGAWAVFLGRRWCCTEPNRKLAMESAEQLVEANNKDQVRND